MTNRLNRRGQTNSTLLIGIGIAAVVVIGIIIAVAVNHHNKEAAKTRSQAHLAACRTLETQIHQEKSPLAGAGLSFQPYQGRYDEAVRKEKQAEAILERDPQQADRLADEAETGLKAVLSDCQLAVQVKTDTSGSSSLADASEYVRQAREGQVQWNYPDAAFGGRQERYRFDESGHNPDTHLGACRRLLGTIDAALEAGLPQEAARILSEAKSETAAAKDCIKTELAAKARVEAQISGIRRYSEAEDASLETAVQTAYFQQQFVSAANRMDSLKKQIDDRKETRELLAYCQRLSRDVERSLDDNRDYTPPACDQRYDALRGQITILAESVKQSNANWSGLKSSAQSIEKGLNQVKDEAQEARRDYDEAVLAVKSFRRDYEQADRNGTPPLTFWSQSSHPEISDPVKDKVRDINDLDTRISRQVKLSKQDWKQIKTDAEAGAKTLSDVKVMVEEDYKKLDQLRDQKDLLKQVTNYDRYTCTVNGKNFRTLTSRDGEFTSHWDSAGDRYDAAVRAWRARERVGFEDALRSLKQEISTLNNIGWYNLLRTLRTSDDLSAQKIAWENGFRDDKSRAEWVDQFVNKRATGPNGLWEPEIRSTIGGGSVVAPDFKAPLSK